MKKGLAAGVAAIAAGLVVVLGILSSDSTQKTVEGYHVTLADPELYKDGVFTDTFQIQGGNYQLRFTPSGDSPKVLSITLKGDSFAFSEDFELKGTAHETGISVYYTWDYLGEKEIHILKDQELQIEIDPHDNVLGPVSVDLIST